MHLQSAIFEDGELSEEARAVDAAAGGRLKSAVARGDISGRAGESLLLLDLPGIKATRVLVTGLGSRKDFSRKAWRRAADVAIAALLRTRVTSIAVALHRPAAKELDDYYLGRAIAEITGAKLYRINDLKTAKKPKPSALERVIAGPVSAAKAAAARRGMAHGAAIAAAARMQRDLGNLPPNICTPTLSRRSGARPRQEISVGQGAGAGRGGDPQGEDGLLPRGHAGQR